jgi:type I restriction enzyme S subunit
VTTEQLFAKFELFAGAPDALPRLRQLILELAVRGQLTTHSSTPPKNHPSAPSDSSAPPFPIPEDWQWVRFGDFIAEGLGSVNPADSPKKLFELWSVPAYANGEPDVLVGAEIGSTKRELPDGSILLGKINPHLNRVWQVSRRTGHQLIASPEWITIQPSKAYESRYMSQALRSPSFNQALCSTAQGMGSLTRASTKKVRDLLIPLPPLAEQKRIVAKVDELMVLCDQLEAQQQERETKHAALSATSLARFAEAPTPANLNFLFHHSYDISPADLRKTILTLAVQGKLVSQDRNDELPQIPSCAQTVVESQWVSRLQLPDTWLWVRFESLLAVLKNGFNGKPSKVVGKFKITRIETISRETVDLARVGYADNLPADVVAKHAVQKGDILFSHINSEPHIGKTAICTIDDPSLVHGVNLLLLRPIAGIDSRYLNIALRELRAAGYFVSIAQRAVNQASINQKNLGNTPIPIPPLTEQRRIVAKVDHLMALVDQLEEQLATSRTLAAQLTEAVVTELTAAA